jgi:hypothetical protein
MMRLAFATVLAALAFVGAAVAARSAFTATLCVGPGPGCYPTIQAAVDAAHDGGTIKVAPGTYAGGISIGKSVRLAGAGAAVTTIRGGGPVVTIGVTSGTVEPTVSISGVTITGGVTDVDLNTGDALFAAAGGGVDVLPLHVGDDYGTGATVAIADSVITGNRAEPVTTDPDPCDPGNCFAYAEGGGISNFGRLTLTNTLVTGNVAGAQQGAPSVTAEAHGGGIYNHVQGTLTIANSVVSDNHARATTPNGTETSGGGIKDHGVLQLSNSRVTGNSSELSSSFPGSLFDGSEAAAEGGGITIQPSGSATITSSAISGNIASADNAGGDVNAGAAGIDSDGSLTLSDSSVDNNQAHSSVPPASGFVAIALGGGLEVEIGSTTVNNTRIHRNGVRAESASGLVAVNGAAFMNENGGTLTLHNSDVSENNVVADGAFGFANGGGISNVSAVPLIPPAGPLTLVNSRLTDNVVTASPGITPMGGGLFTADVLSFQPLPVTLIHTVIAGNSPDQCFGC